MVAKTAEEARAEHRETSEVQDAAVYLKQIAGDMQIMRVQLTEVVRYMREAESEVPESLRRFIAVLSRFSLAEEIWQTSRTIWVDIIELL